MKIKIKALSLALLSIAWIGQAQAQWSGSGSSGCPDTNNGDTCTINNSVSGSLTGSGNLVISTSGSVSVSGTSGNAINASGTFTIANSGSISAPNATHGIKVSGNGPYSGAITNNVGGSISGKWNGISVETGSDASGTIAIHNSGSISGVSGQGILISGSGLTATIQNEGTISGATSSSGVGINIQSAASGSKIESSGDISANVGVSTSAVLDSISISGGTVKGSYRGITLYNQVQKLSISSGATVEAGDGDQGFWRQHNNNAGLLIQSGSGTMVENHGTIRGPSGILVQQNGMVDSITNSGTIESTSTQEWASAITMVNLYKNPTIKTLTNSGKILAPYANGIAMEYQTTIEKFVNQGTIEVGIDGIRFFDMAGAGAAATIGSIELASGSQIIAGQNGLNLTATSGNKPVNIGKIDIQSGASITAQSGSALVIGSTTVVSGNSIQVNGSLTSKQSAILIQGTVGASGTQTDVLTIGSGASLQSTDGYDLENNGVIHGNVSITTNQRDITFKNSGTLNGTLKVSGTSNHKVIIKDWSVQVEALEAPYGDVQAKATTVQIEATDPKQVEVQQVSINTISSALLNSNIDFQHAFKVSGQYVDLDETPTAVKIGSVPSSLGFDGSYDPKTKIFYTSFNVAQTAGAVVSQTLANQLMRRDFFLESAITEAATGSLYHRRLEGVDGTAFVKPYASSDTFDLNGANMDGSTQGVMVGINRFVGRHLLTGYVGFERSEIDSDFRSSTMNLDVQSWYGGFNTAHLLQSNSFVDTFLKGSLKASYTTTGIDRQILLNANTTSTDNVVGSNASVIQSNAKPNTVAVGMNVQMGMNLKPLKETQIIPMVGLGYSIGKTSSYQLDRTGLINDSYMPERVMMPYADASVTWFQGWGKIVRTFVGGGMRYILDRTQKTALSYGKLPIEGEYSLPQSFQYVNASMVLHVNAGSEIALGYTGVFDSTGHSQNVTAKYELHF